MRPLALAVVRDLREQWVPTSDEELADFETDVLAGFVLARASAGVADSTIRNDTNHLELVRNWFDRPLWEMQPTDAYFGKVLRNAKPSTRTGRAAALTVFFQFLDTPTGRGLVFGDPTRHLRGGRSANRVVVPMTTAEIAQVHRSVHHPAQRLAISLAAVHGARPRGRPRTHPGRPQRAQQAHPACRSRATPWRARPAHPAGVAGTPAANVAAHHQPARPALAHQRAGHRACQH